MTAPTLACPPWCNRICHQDDPSLHVQNDIVVRGPSISGLLSEEIEMSLSHDDHGRLGAAYRKPRIMLGDYDLGMRQAEELAQQLLRLVDLGRRS